MRPPKLSRRRVLASIPPALLLPTLSGCLPQFGSSEPITIRVLVPLLTDAVMDTMPERVKALVDQLNGASRTTKFEMTRLPTVGADYADGVESLSGQKGKTPDLLIANMGDVPALADRGLILPLDRYIKDDRDVKLDDYFPAVLAANRYKGQLYALPFICSPLVIYYNPRMFAAAGVKAPTSTWTWQEFVQTARALTRAGASGGAGEQFGFIQAPDVPPISAYIWQNGGDILDSDGRVILDQPAAVEAIKFMADLTLTERVTPQLSDLTSRAVEDLVLKDKVGMFMFYLSIGIFWRGEAGFDFQLAEVPQGRARVTTLTESALAVGAKTTNPELAYRALRAVVGEAEKITLVPPRRSLARDMKKIESRLSDQDIRVITNSLEYARGPVYQNHHRVMSVLRNLVQIPALAGAVSPQAAATSGAIAVYTLTQQTK
jgi:multiple sugar transport system substrate-binding protein